MVMESIEKIMGGLGSADVDSRLDKFNLNLDLHAVAKDY